MLIRFWCIPLKKFRCCSKFLISLTQCYRRKLRAIVPNSDYFKPIILKFKHLFIIAIVISYIIFVYMGAILPQRWGSNPPGKKFFTVDIFRKNTSKCVKLMVEPYICDNLNKIFGFLSFFNNKKKLKSI